jgi:hypothetical protein
MEFSEESDKYSLPLLHGLLIVLMTLEAQYLGILIRNLCLFSLDSNFLEALLNHVSSLL